MTRILQMAWSTWNPWVFQWILPWHRAHGHACSWLLLCCWQLFILAPWSELVPALPRIWVKIGHRHLSISMDFCHVPWKKNGHELGTEKPRWGSKTNSRIYWITWTFILSPFQKMIARVRVVFLRSYPQTAPLPEFASQSIPKLHGQTNLSQNHFTTFHNIQDLIPKTSQYARWYDDISRLSPWNYPIHII